MRLRGVSIVLLPLFAGCSLWSARDAAVPDVPKGFDPPQALRQYNLNSAKGGPLAKGATPESRQIEFEGDFSLPDSYCPGTEVTLEAELVPADQVFTGSANYRGRFSHPICPNGPCQTKPGVELPIPFDGQAWHWQARVRYRYENFDNINFHRVCRGRADEGVTRWIEFSPGEASFRAPMPFVLQLAELANLSVERGTLASGALADLGPEDAVPVVLHSTGSGAPAASASVTANIEPEVVHAIHVSLVSRATQSCRQDVEIQRNDGQWVLLDHRLISANTTVTLRDLVPPGDAMQYLLGVEERFRIARAVVRATCARSVLGFDYSLDVLHVVLDASVGKVAR